MSESCRLRLGDVRAAFRLIGECTELGADPFIWRTHLFEGLCQLTGATVAIGGESDQRPVDPGVRFLHVVYTGLNDDDWRPFRRYMAQEGYHTIDPALERFFRPYRSLVTRSHEQLIRSNEWKRSVLFNEHFRPMRIDYRMISFCEMASDSGKCSNLWNGITLYRALGDRPFTARDRRLVHLIHHELRPLMGTKLATCRGLEFRALSPRLRQVRDLLLVGKSEKQIANQLGLAQSSIHKYVTMLYRRYGVSGRAELMARFLHWSATT